MFPDRDIEVAELDGAHRASLSPDLHSERPGAHPQALHGFQLFAYQQRFGPVPIRLAALVDSQEPLS